MRSRSIRFRSLFCSSTAGSDILLFLGRRGRLCLELGLVGGLGNLKLCIELAAIDFGVDVLDQNFKALADCDALGVQLLAADLAAILENQCYCQST